MSLRLRREIGFWALLIIGISLNAFQLYKYFTNQLEGTMLELVVLIVGLAFNLMPRYLLRLFEKFVLKRND